MINGTKISPIKSSVTHPARKSCQEILSDSLLGNSFVTSEVSEVGPLDFPSSIHPSPKLGGDETMYLFSFKKRF